MKFEGKFFHVINSYHISVSPEDLLLNVESVAYFYYHYYLWLVVFVMSIMRSCLIQQPINYVIME